MKRDVLLTGATGLIGGEIALRLIKSGRRVWCVVRSKSFSEAAARVEHRFARSGQPCDWSRVVAVPGDITVEGMGIDDQTLTHLGNECGHVIHAAAETSFAHHNCCLRVNVIGTQNVVNVCESFGPQVRLFHISSAVTCGETESGVVREDSPPAEFSNDYVKSKCESEQIVLNSSVNAVVLRPSIVLSHGLRDRTFARAILWVLPVIRELGVLPLTGDERIDAVSVQFVAECVSTMLERSLPHRILHLSAGVEASISWREVFSTLTNSGHEFSHMRFDPDLDWKTFDEANPRTRRLKDLLSFYLPFMRAGTIYDSSRARECLGGDFPDCPPLTHYCPDLLSQFTDREAFEEALIP